tara:strand:+ start:176 stop:316 length:141 start_codon:yes stop_codon:yes gene_type:complete
MRGRPPRYVPKRGENGEASALESFLDGEKWQLTKKPSGNIVASSSV